MPVIPHRRELVDAEYVYLTGKSFAHSFDGMMKYSIEPLDTIILPITISGSRSSRTIDSLLDTGASYLVITREDAIDLGYDLTFAPPFDVVTANGIVRAPRIVLNSVTLGPYTVRNIPTLCLDMSGDRISSLLGLSFLSHFKMNLDFKGQILEIEDC